MRLAIFVEILKLANPSGKIKSEQLLRNYEDEPVKTQKILFCGHTKNPQWSHSNCLRKLKIALYDSSLALVGTRLFGLHDLCFSNYYMSRLFVSEKLNMQTSERAIEKHCSK